MPTYKVVYEFRGEWDTNKAVTPICLLEDFTGDLTEQKRGILSFDDFRPAMYDRWQVRSVQLPDWLPFDEWRRRPWDWHSVTQWGIEDETLGRYLATLDERRFNALRKLMTKNLRSEFRKSLRDQVQAWLDAAPQDREYRSPLSPRQWDALTRYER